jgi:hypothetical protein
MLSKNKSSAKHKLHFRELTIQSETQQKHRKILTANIKGLPVTAEQGVGLGHSCSLQPLSVKGYRLIS